VAPDAAELARRSVQQWNAADLEAIYADWDPEITVRPDANFPDAGELVGVHAARRFWEDQREFMGIGHAEILEEHDLGDRCLLRIRQHVEAREAASAAHMTRRKGNDDRVLHRS
jgi:hypothetical protein